MQNNTIYSFFYNIYPELKFWASAGGTLWVIFKVVSWMKAIKTNDLANIKKAVTALETGMKEQTISIVTELKEMRSDFRGFTNAFIVPPRARARRKK